MSGARVCLPQAEPFFSGLPCLTSQLKYAATQGSVLTRPNVEPDSSHACIAAKIPWALGFTPGSWALQIWTNGYLDDLQAIVL